VFDKSRATKVLYVDHAPFWGGAEMILETHLTLLDRERFSPIVAVAMGNERAEMRFAQAGAKVVAISFGRLKTANPLVFWRWFKTIFELREIIKREGIELVVACTSRAYYTAAVAAQLSRVPLVVWVHDFLYVKPLFKLFRLLTAGIVWSSEAVREFYGGRVSEKSQVIYNENYFGRVLAAVSSAEGAKLREVWGVGARDVVIGSVGRLVTAKGVAVLLRAVAILKGSVEEMGTNFKVVVVGSGGGQRGGNEDELRELVRSLGLEEGVVFVGFQEAPAVFYRAFDIFVLPSTGFESFPTAVVEAMLAGLPVVGTRKGGTVELVDDERTGFLIPPEDPEALAAALVKLCKSPPLRETMGAAGREKAQDESAGSGSTRKMEEFFLKILGHDKAN